MVYLLFGPWPVLMRLPILVELLAAAAWLTYLIRLPPPKEARRRAARRALLDEVEHFAELESSRLAARGVTIRRARSPHDRGYPSASIALDRLPHATADLTVWASGEAELGAAWGQVAGGWQRQLMEHAEFAGVPDVQRALARLVQLVAADPLGHGLQDDFVPRTDEEMHYLTALLGRVPDLDVRAHEDSAGPWLLVSLDLVAGGAVRDVARLDFDGTRIVGGWNPALVNRGDGVRAAAAGIEPGSPDWITMDGTPAHLAEASVAWFAGIVERWPRERGAGRLR
jgi:hypothetical protein